MTARCVMVLGTTSGAGKSWLATALCRWYAQRGLKVAPFKAQNMSNNARVVPRPDRRMGEIGSAQYFQALAARAAPDVRMNPVLLKPEHDTASQVVVLGEVRADLARTPWRERSQALWPYARDALRELRSEHDLVVIEGAGSPAEVNLAASDYVNLGTLRESEAAALLVCDIDRGGAFAHLFGTHQLMEATDRQRLRGFVLNRFRGDAALLAPGPELLEARTGVPTLAVLPMWREHGLPEEDGVFDDAPRGDRGGLRVAVVAYPRISNLDEFAPLRAARGVRLSWARSAADLADADWVVLPGSKHTGGDLAWLRRQRLDAAIAAHARAGRPVLGVCGGLQMLGEALVDTQGIQGIEGIDGGSGPAGSAGLDASAPGLGLLPLVTRFERDKLLRPVTARFSALEGPWSALSGLSFEGYEIRQGRTVAHPAMAAPRQALHNAAGEVIGWQHGCVLGLYAHGLFESPTVMAALFGAESRSLDSVFDGLADFVDRHFAAGALARLSMPTDA